MRDGAVRAFAAGAVALAVLAGACVPSDDVEVPSGNPSAVRGGAVVIGIGPPGSIEPSNAYEPVGRLISGLVCDSLAAYDARTGELKPALAESWQVSDDGTRLTVRLRDDVRFHDGRKLTADDVAFTLTRAASADYAGLAAPLLRPVAGYGEVHGDIETDDDRDRRRLRGVRAVTARTVELDLQSPLADFTQVLGHPIMAPVSEAAAEARGEQFGAQPVCAGPYRVAEPWNPGDSVIKLVRFDDYYAGNAAFTAGGAGYLDSIEFRVFPDAASQVEAFRRGDVDIAHVPPELVRSTGREPGARLVQAPTTRIEYVGGALSGTTLFGNKAVRLALSQALDRRRLVDEVLGGAGAPATGFLSPALGMSTEDTGCGGRVAERADLGAARAALAAEGLTLDGAHVRFSFNDETQNGALVGAMAEQWRTAFGLDIELVPMPWEEYIAQAQGSPGLEGLFRVSWEPPYPSADAALFPVFHSNGIGAGNLGRFTSGEVDRVIDRARKTVSEEDRALDYGKVEAALCEDLPLLPVLFGTSNLLVRDGRLDSAVEAFADRTSGEPVVRELFVKAGS